MRCSGPTRITTSRFAPAAAGPCLEWLRASCGHRPAKRKQVRTAMAQEPKNIVATIERFGPHLSFMRGERVSTAVDPDKLVKTHCCFCGQQCGIQLKVKDSQVIGFEPWEDFPFNRGMLCPKGVKRYLQDAHPDRLLTAFRRDPSAPGGFSPMPY